MKASTTTLLRRTAAIVAAAGSFLFIGEAAAAPPIRFINPPASGTCTLARITVQPDGALGVECEASTAPGVPIITLSGPASMAVGTLANFSVNRSGDNGAIAIAWAATGSAPGCNGAGGTMNFTASGPNSFGFSLTPSGNGTCTVAISGPVGSSAGVIGTPSQAIYSIGSTAPPPPPPPPPPSGTCPAGFVQPSDLVEGSLILSGAEQIFLSSGRVYSSLIPRTNPGRLSGAVKLGETTSSPQQLQSIEMSISKCKGEIKTDGGSCYLKSQQGAWNTLTWVESSIPGLSDADATAYGVCMAKHTDGPWYYNMRYTYSACHYGTCSYVLQWNNGPF